MKILKYSIYLSLLLVLGGCSGILDVNTDPTRVSADEVGVDVLLPTVIEGTSRAFYSEGYSASRVTHHLDAVTNGYYDEFTMAGAWSTIYLKNLNNIELLIAKAEDEGSSHYAGVAKVLKAINLGLLTDAWEDVPYTEALQGSENIAPKYDKQEFIYSEIQKILDNAITDLSSDNNFRDIGKDDFIYNGSVENWIKLAHSFKARFMIHLSNKSNMNWNAVLDEVSLGLTSNDDDFQLFYPDDIGNPWYKSVSKKITESIYTVTYGAYFIDNLNGVNFGGAIDPRLLVLAEKTDTTPGYHGAAGYDEEATPFNVLPTVNTFYMTPESPLVMMSYSELKFIEAEAALKAGNLTIAQDAYEAAVAANMTKLGVSGDSYLADAGISTVSLQNVMTQKHVALVFNPEAWNDMRRYDFSSDVFKNFVVPEYNGRTEPGQRAIYPSSESSRNKANYEANLKEFTEKMWKDKN